MSIGVGILLVVACIVAFLGFLQHVIRNLRPVAVADSITSLGLAAIRRLYRPWEGRGSRSASLVKDELPVGSSSQVVTYAGEGRVLRGLDTAGLVADARRAGYVLVLLVAGSPAHPSRPVWACPGYVTGETPTSTPTQPLSGFL